MATKDTCTIVDGDGEKIEIEARINEIKSQLEFTKSDFDKERLAKLTGGVAIVKVGAATEVEQRDKHHRVEDAVSATKAAAEEGIVTVTLKEGPHGTLVLEAQDGRTILVQMMSDMPGVASAFGWQACPCRKTDGTISCEHRKASDMIESAYRFLQTNIGLTEADPGYF